MIFQISNTSPLLHPRLSLLPAEKPPQSLDHPVSPLSTPFPAVQPSLHVGREQTAGRIHQGFTRQHPACLRSLTTHGSPETQLTCPPRSSPRCLLRGRLRSQSITYLRQQHGKKKKKKKKSISRPGEAVRQSCPLPR